MILYQCASVGTMNFFDTIDARCYHEDCASIFSKACAIFVFAFFNV